MSFLVAGIMVLFEKKCIDYWSSPSVTVCSYLSYFEIRYTCSGMRCIHRGINIFYKSYVCLGIFHSYSRDICFIVFWFWRIKSITQYIKL